MGREKVFQALIYYGGLRVTEACMLRRTDVRFGANPAMWVNGKGSKERVVPMVAELEEILREWVQLHTTRLDSKEPLVAQSNGKHYQRKTVERMFAINGVRRPASRTAFRTASATPSPRRCCWTAAPTSASSKPCSATAAWTQPRSIRGSSTRTWSTR